MSTCHASASLVVLTALASAQPTIVSPAPFKTLIAPSLNTHPIGTATATSTAMRYMSIHDDMSGKVGVIKGLAFRVNEGASSVATTLTMEVRISTAAVLGAAATTTFDTNHGADKATVVPASTPFNFAAQPATTPVAPNPFALKVPFTTNFTFLGTGGIAWEMQISNRTNTSSFSLDAFSAGTFLGSSASFGAGCIAGGTSTARAATASTTIAATMTTLTGVAFAASAPGTIVLGTGTTMWGATPLPYTVPLTTGYPSGTCTVYTDWLVDFPQMSSTTGGLTQAFPITIGPATLGVQVHHYGIGLDAAANGFGLVTSNARTTVLGDAATYGGCRVYLTTSATGATGTKDSTIVVTEFQL